MVVDLLVGEAGNDKLYGGDGDDLLVGDNTLVDSGGNDYLVGGNGNDRLYGNYGDDTYVYSVNTGIDIINDGLTAAEVPGFGGGIDTLLFNGTTLDDIYLGILDGTDLYFYSSAGVGSDGSINHAVIIQDFFLNNESTNIEYLKDGAGNTFDLSLLLDLDDASASYTTAMHSIGSLIAA